MPPLHPIARCSCNALMFDFLYLSLRISGGRGFCGRNLCIRNCRGSWEVVWGYNFIASNMQDCAGGGEDKTKSVRQSSKLVRRISGALSSAWCGAGFVHMVSPRMQPYIRRGFFLVFFGKDSLQPALPTSKGETLFNARLPFLSCSTTTSLRI